MSEPQAHQRIQAVTLQAGRNVARVADAAYERDVAVRDLIESGAIDLVAGEKGPYSLHLAADAGKVNLTVTSTQSGAERTLQLSLSPFRRLIKDYFLICESHIEATKWAHTEHLQTLDMARRGIHNEGAELLKSLLDSKAVMDFNTARRVFTLICVLHIT